MAVHRRGNKLERWEIGLIKAMVADGRWPNDQDILAYFTRPTRSINRRVVITTSVSFSHWGGVFGDAKMTTALLDRLTRHCNILETENYSFRFRAGAAAPRNSKEKTGLLNQNPQRGIQQPHGSLLNDNQHSSDWVPYLS